MTTVFSGDTGALAVGAGTVGATQIIDGSITGSKLASATVAVSNLAQPMTLMTAAVAPQGSTIDFSISSWAKRITVMLNELSPTSTSFIQVQVGTSGGMVTTGYKVSATMLSTSSVSSAAHTTGFVFRDTNSTQLVALSGHLILTNISGNTWIGSGITGDNYYGVTQTTGGSIVLGSSLTTVRITTTGADTFDAGSVNVMYE